MRLVHTNPGQSASQQYYRSTSGSSGQENSPESIRKREESVGKNQTQHDDIIKIAELLNQMQPSPQQFRECYKPEFYGLVETLAYWERLYKISTDDAERDQLMYKRIAISLDVIEAIYIEAVTFNLEHLKALSPSSRINWGQLSLGDDHRFQVFLYEEEHLFLEAGLSKETVSDLRLLLSRARELAGEQPDEFNIEEFKRIFNDVRDTLRLLKSAKLAEISGIMVRRKVVQVFCIAVTVMDAAGPFVYPFLSYEVYAASVTLGGVGLTATTF